MFCYVSPLNLNAILMAGREEERGGSPRRCSPTHLRPHFDTVDLALTTGSINLVPASHETARPDLGVVNPVVNPCDAAGQGVRKLDITSGKWVVMESLVQPHPAPVPNKTI